MADFVIRVGHRTAKGLRSNNEDNYVVDKEHNLFLVADGMGGQECGEKASSLAAEIIPKVVQDRLAAQQEPSRAVQDALAQANEAIVSAGRNQPVGRRMGTTAVLAVQKANQVYVAGLGDSRAYLIRGASGDLLSVGRPVSRAQW